MEVHDCVADQASSNFSFCGGLRYDSPADTNRLGSLNSIPGPSIRHAIDTKQTPTGPAVACFKFHSGYTTTLVYY